MSTVKTNQEILAALEAPFPPEQVRERVGHGGTKLSWVPARLVAQRLDEVIGVGGWDFHLTRIADGIVYAQLFIRFPDGSNASRGDYGYETGGSGEGLKEASSDALRRAASLFGVARYLYAGDMPRVEPMPQKRAPKMSGPNAVREMRYAGSDPIAEQNASKSDDEALIRAAMDFARSIEEGNCPDHNLPWSYKPAGTSRAGKPYAGFWSCKVRDANGWCQKKPSIKWIAEQPVEETRMVPEPDPLADLIDIPKPTASDLGEELPF